MVRGKFHRETLEGNLGIEFEEEDTEEGRRDEERRRRSLAECQRRAVAFVSAGLLEALGGRVVQTKNEENG